MTRSRPSVLPYQSIAAQWLTLDTGACVLGYRVRQPLAALPRLPVDLFTLYHLRRRAAFPPALRGGPPAATHYLVAYHEHPRETLADDVVLTLRAPSARDAALVAAQYNERALEPMTGAELAAFLRRTTTFADDAPRFEGLAHLSQAILPYEVFGRMGPLATSASYPSRIALVVATEPPPETTARFLASVLSYRGPILITAHFAPEPVTVTAAAARRALRHQRSGGGEALANDDAKELTRELYAGNRQAGLMSITLAVPADASETSQRLAGPKTLWESSTGWLCREPGLDAVATYLSQYHRPELLSSRPRLTSANFLDLVTLPRQLGDTAPFAYFEGPRGDAQPFSPYVADVGHTLIVGPTGAGKSVFLGHLTMAALAARHEVTLFDQHQGFTRLARELGGATRTCSPGAPLDNPFARPLTDALRTWWILFLQSTVPDANAALCDLAVTTLYEQPAAGRDMGVLLDMCEQNDLDPSGLLPWYDGASEAVFHPGNPPLPDHAIEHFDITAIYREPLLLSYLTTRLLEQLGRGRRRLLIFDEAWAAFGTPYLRAFLDSALRTARKLGGALLFAAQRPTDFVGWHENIITRVFLPNPNLTLEHAIQIAPVGQDFVDVVNEAIPKRDYIVSRDTAWAQLRLDLSPLPGLLELHQPTAGAAVALATT